MAPIDDAQTRILAEKNAKDIEHLVIDLRRLADAIDTLTNALRRLADAIDTLTNALWSHGHIGGDTANTVSDLVRKPSPAGDDGERVAEANARKEGS